MSQCPSHQSKNPSLIIWRSIDIQGVSTRNGIRALFHTPYLPHLYKRVVARTRYENLWWIVWSYHHPQAWLIFESNQGAGKHSGSAYYMTFSSIALTGCWTLGTKMPNREPQSQILGLKKVPSAIQQTANKCPVISVGHQNYDPTSSALMTLPS